LIAEPAAADAIRGRQQVEQLVVGAFQESASSLESVSPASTRSANCCQVVAAEVSAGCWIVVEFVTLAFLLDASGDT
jgi:hypothetical protein